METGNLYDELSDSMSNCDIIDNLEESILLVSGCSTLLTSNVEGFGCCEDARAVLIHTLGNVKDKLGKIKNSLEIQGVMVR